MALQGVVRVEVPSEVVFPLGAQVLGVEPELDFDKQKAAREAGEDRDVQKRDADTPAADGHKDGERVWQVRVVDLDPEALKFGGSAEAKVRIVAAHQPVPPKRVDPRFPPLVAFEGLTMTPYVNAKRCKDGKPGNRRDCGCRVGFSLRATGMVAAQVPAPAPEGNGSEGTSAEKPPARSGGER